MTDRRMDWDENSEQQDEESQAHNVADAALDRTGEPDAGSTKTETSPHQITPDDTPDLVDRIEQMVSSGQIDEDAFAGEPQHDDEADPQDIERDIAQDDLPEDLEPDDLSPDGPDFDDSATAHDRAS